jgi:hypothetical protein
MALRMLRVDADWERQSVDTTSPGAGPGNPGAGGTWGEDPAWGHCALADKWLQQGLIGRNSENSVP